MRSPDDDLASSRDRCSGVNLVIVRRGPTPPFGLTRCPVRREAKPPASPEFECHFPCHHSHCLPPHGATVRFRGSPLEPRMGAPLNMRSRYADDALFVKRDKTKPVEIQAFVERRTLNPLEIEGVTVWNYNNHVPIKRMLTHAITKYDLEDGSKWMIPYNITPLWAYMHELLPPQVKEAGYILYDEEEAEYSTFPSLYAEGSRERDEQITEDLAEKL